MILRGREDEAREVLAALADVPVDHKEVTNEFTVIRETVLEMSKGKFSDLFTQGKDRYVLHRARLSSSVLAEEAHSYLATSIELCWRMSTRCSVSFDDVFCL